MYRSPHSRQVLIYVDYDAKVLTGADRELILELRDYTESVVGKVFDLELAHIDVRIAPFGEYDDFSAPLFVRVIAQRLDPNEELKDIPHLIHQSLLSHFEGYGFKFRLWVEFATAQYFEF